MQPSGGQFGLIFLTAVRLENNTRIEKDSSALRFYPALLLRARIFFHEQGPEHSC